MSGVIELRLERGQRLARLPVGVGHYRHGFFELHDALDARHLFRARGVDCDELAAVHRRNLDCGMQQAWQREVNAVDGAAIHSRPHVQPRARCASQCVGVGILQRRTRRHGLRGRRFASSPKLAERPDAVWSRASWRRCTP